MVANDAEARKLQRALEELVDDELTAYRSVVEEGHALSLHDSETIGSRSCRSDTLDVNGLKNERLLMQRLGFVEHVYALDERIKFAEDRKRKEIENRHAEQRERRMRMLVATHERRLIAFVEGQAGAVDELVASHEVKIKEVAERHRTGGRAEYLCPLVLVLVRTF